MSNETERSELRPWGRFLLLDVGEGFQVKRIEVHAGRRLSYQSHRHRSEHWFVVQGTALVTLDGVQHPLQPGDAIDIPLGARHRVANPGAELLVFIEVQRGGYLGEDDIERYEDDFGRASGDVTESSAKSARSDTRASGSKPAAS
jgi:mannose-6-phosphate isomerase